MCQETSLGRAPSTPGWCERGRRPASAWGARRAQNEALLPPPALSGCETYAPRQKTCLTACCVACRRKSGAAGKKTQQAPRRPRDSRRGRTFWVRLRRSVLPRSSPLAGRASGLSLGTPWSPSRATEQRREETGWWFAAGRERGGGGGGASPDGKTARRGGGYVVSGICCCMSAQAQQRLSDFHWV